MSTEELVQEAALALFKAAIEAGMTLSADGRVGESDAATLLGIAPGTLKNMRAEGSAPSHYKVGVARGRVSYRCLDLACWIEERRRQN